MERFTDSRRARNSASEITGRRRWPSRLSRRRWRLACSRVEPCSWSSAAAVEAPPREPRERRRLAPAPSPSPSPDADSPSAPSSPSASVASCCSSPPAPFVVFLPRPRPPRRRLRRAAPSADSPDSPPSPADSPASGLGSFVAWGLGVASPSVAGLAFAPDLGADLGAAFLRGALGAAGADSAPASGTEGGPAGAEARRERAGWEMGSGAWKITAVEGSSGVVLSSLTRVLLIGGPHTGRRYRSIAVRNLRPRKSGRGSLCRAPIPDNPPCEASSDGTGSNSLTASVAWVASGVAGRFLGDHCDTVASKAPAPQLPASREARPGRWSQCV